jgi:adenylate kinase
MLNLVLFGPPGAGKGTQSEKLIAKYKLVHLSTGDILRNEIKNQTELGKQAKAFMDKGELVPDNIVIGMIASKIDANINSPGFIFDGFPRTINQAKELDKMLAQRNLSISAMISLEVEHDELVKRLLGRGKISGRADDQDVSVIENRIKVYNNETAPLIEYYKKQGKHFGIHGIGSIDDIFENICKTIEGIK